MDFSKYDKIDIHFIIGPGRSGTTLLAMILNQHPNCISTPELKHFVYFYKKYKGITSINKELLEDLSKYFAVVGVTKKNILFDTPDINFSPKHPAVNCFLYDIRENSDLRSSEWLFDKNTDGTAFKKRAPLWLNCNYMITAWADSIENEHRLLGEVFTTLLAYEVNQTDGRNTDAQHKKNSSTFIKLNNSESEQSIELWRALGVKPRSALSYTLTSSVEKQVPEKVVLVKDKIINMDVKKEIV